MSMRPSQDEYGDFFGRYIRLVPDGSVEDGLEERLHTTAELVKRLSEEQGNYRYTDGKWSLKEVIGHITDNERIMAYRLLRIARGDNTPLPGYDQDKLISPFARYTMAELADDYAAVRRSTLTLLRGLPGEAWDRRGTANNNELTARALAYIIAGHELHHLQIIRDRYLTPLAH